MDMAGFVQSLPTGVFAFVELFLVACAGIFVAAGVQARRRAALVEKTETSPIEFAQDGYREFEGRIEPAGAELAAPLTGWNCVWYRAKVERHVSNRRNQEGGWQTVSDRASDEAFVVRDATGASLVYPLGAEVTPTDFSVWYGATEEPEDRNPEKKAPTEPRTPMVEIAGSNRYRYTEERIYAGDPLLALGHFTSGRFTGTSAAGAIDRDDEEEEPEPAVAATGIRACLATGRGKPLVLTTTSQAAHVAMSQLGGQAALYMAVAFAGIAALLAYVRFQ